MIIHGGPLSMGDILQAPSWHAVLLATLGFTFAYTAYIIYNLFLHPLKDVPGPFISRSGAFPFMAIHCFRQDVAWTIEGLHRRYGPTIRIGRNRIATIDPNAVQKIYGHGSNFNKSRFYDFFSITGMPSAFTSRDIHEHAMIRRIISSAFTLSALIELEEYVDEVMQVLLRQLDQSAEERKHIDLAVVSQYFAMDVVGELGFGQSFNLLSEGKDRFNILPSLDVGLWVASMLGSIPTFGRPIFKFLLLLPIPGAQYLDRIANSCVDERMRRADVAAKDGYDARKDMLTKLVKARNPDTKIPLSREEIITHASTIIGAGSDTTSITMRAFFAFVIARPKVMARLRQEIDEAVDSGNVVLPASYAQGAQLEYFRACLKETLRMWPAVAHPMERVVPQGDVTHIDQFIIPPGTIVGTSSLAFHRSYEAFGEDAKTFNPERWLGINDDQRKILEKNNIAFGAGARVCIGKNISLMELTKVIPQLIYRYDFSFTERNEGSPHHHKLGRGFDGKEGKDVPYYVESNWFTNPKDFWCNISKRPREEAL